MVILSIVILCIIAMGIYGLLNLLEKKMEQSDQGNFSSLIAYPSMKHFYLLFRSINLLSDILTLTQSTVSTSYSSYNITMALVSLFPQLFLFYTLDKYIPMYFYLLLFVPYLFTCLQLSTISFPLGVFSAYHVSIKVAIIYSYRYISTLFKIVITVSSMLCLLSIYSML